MKLDTAAREEIRAAGLSVAAYCRHFFPGGKWGGDRCGCPDDRCIGFHHDEMGECGCLPVTISEAREERPVTVSARLVGEALIGWQLYLDRAQTENRGALAACADDEARQAYGHRRDERQLSVMRGDFERLQAAYLDALFP